MKMADKIKEETTEQKTQSIWNLPKEEFDKLPKEPLTGRWALENNYMENRLPPEHWDEVRRGKYLQKKSE